MNLRSRLSGIATGDQGIFVRRDTFFALGGFPDQPLMEDIELSKRLKAHSSPRLPAPEGDKLGQALGRVRRLAHHSPDVAATLPLLARCQRHAIG